MTVEFKYSYNHTSRYDLLEWVLGFVFIVFSNMASGQSAWPSIALPKEVETFWVAENVSLNGIPMRIQGFLAPTKPAQLAAWLRESLGQPLVENTLGNKLVLGRMQGENYTTIQLEAAGNGTRGLITTTDLKRAAANQAQTVAVNERWLSRLPFGSKIMSQMTSEDGPKISTHMVISNTYSEAINRDYLIRLMREDAYQFENMSMPGGKSKDAVPKTLYFKAAAKEAMATMQRASDGTTVIVFNNVTQLQRIK
jgi:hypothetical protein